MAVLDTKTPEEVAQFKEALKAAPAWRLYQIIRDVCKRLPAAIPIVSDFLLVTEDEVAVKREDDDLDSEPEPDSETMEMRSARLAGMRRIHLAGRGKGLDLGLHVKLGGVGSCIVRSGCLLSPEDSVLLKKLR